MKLKIFLIKSSKCDIKINIIINYLNIVINSGSFWKNVCFIAIIIFLIELSYMFWNKIIIYFKEKIIRMTIKKMVYLKSPLYLIILFTYCIAVSSLFLARARDEEKQREKYKTKRQEALVRRIKPKIIVHITNQT